MKKGVSSSTEAAELRRSAEDRLRKKTPGKNHPRTEADLHRLLHEMQVHQVELEMQNEELRRAREELEVSRPALPSPLVSPMRGRERFFPITSNWFCNDSSC